MIGISKALGNMEQCYHNHDRGTLRKGRFCMAAMHWSCRVVMISNEAPEAEDLEPKREQDNTALLHPC